MPASSQPSTADLCLPATPFAACRARRALDALIPEGCEDGRLLVSEAVANAVEHTATVQVHVLLRHEPGDRRLLCAVHDTSTTTPATDPCGHADPGAESGRGLHLIDALADVWGYLPDDAGKWLWFSLTPESTQGNAA
ncbi:ATP-binding protein [Streptacidiphilus fuscans]|uniref:ATP-binding protein n=1 Tax=Streptacidiphilus fuscans TaxID=2789292 RepID=A0A931BG06_9ACTN|nr:ATP-binding protein [Streptacidiphilus fuscans]MBF9072780.1 ATP-binding protein [Streptacidiphilus fuscans]